ncbi:ABC transporter substrate-binding protein [Candidatus Acetatifactor stercoripullorum]|uniref:ABC transporter substrate-binding protein n=1 Tax=Candidatus Acetatifactor stercoripullorum TaxID=2838414 RepID=UPI00298D6435|nr:ABC transporter substrate-binding protein [Candidatus Acetatifactor stercoripullorum]
MKRKVLSVLLASAMVVSLAACGGEEASTSTTSGEGSSSESSATSTEAAGTEAAEEGSGYVLETLNMVVNGTLTATVDAGQAEFEAQWEEAVGEAIGHPIDLQIQQLDHSGYVDAVGRLFAGGDYPDVIVMSADMFKQYAPTGLLWDMAEAYDNADFQSHMILPAINENLKDSEGHLYGFAPTYGNGCVTYVKKAWLDAVGIDASTIKTYDDYYNMLLAFHNGDPDGNGVTGDTYGVVAAGFMGNEAPWINYLPEFWQDAYPALVQDENGVWYDGFQTEETKAALLRLRQAYVDGAIDPETLTASTKIAREKWFSNDQTGSAGVFTYWAGSWYQTLTDNLIKNEVDSELVQLAPIAEVGAYLNREAPVWCIIDDGDGDDSREQAIFDAFIETMMDGDTVQTLWTYGAEDVHWSTKAESFTTNPGTENEKVYEYADGEFHLKQSPNDPNSVWKKNHLDPALVVCSLDNGFADQSDLASEGNKFFTENCVDAPASPASETYTNESGTIYDAKLAAITSVVVEGGDVEAAMQTYVDTVGSIIDQCLTELNAAE